MKTSTIYEKRELVLEGLSLGLLFFAVSTVVFCLRAEIAQMAQGIRYVLPALGISLIVGLCLNGLHKRPSSGWLASWFKGITVVYILIALGFLLALAGRLLPGLLREVLLADIFVLAFLWLLDYLFLRYVAKELNAFTQRETAMLVDLDTCPKTAEAFCQAIEAYCGREKHTLAFIERGMPAVIMMDGKRYLVEREMFYTKIGPMYALKFTESNKKVSENK